MTVPPMHIKLSLGDAVAFERRRRMSRPCMYLLSSRVKVASSELGVGFIAAENSSRVIFCGLLRYCDHE